jgi:hypothetical protein
MIVQIKTNTGRVFVAGIYSARCSNWSLVDTPSQIGEIFFDCSEGESFCLAFESDKPASPKASFPIPNPSNASIPSTEEDFFYSDHDLTGLVKVTPCKFLDKPGYSGMILHFSNGHRESVGQVRLDCLCPSIELESSTLLSLGFKTRPDWHPYVAAITTARCSSEMDFEAIIELSCHGRLEWIWSHYQTHVIYEDQKSLKIR